MASKRGTIPTGGVRQDGGRSVGLHAFSGGCLSLATVLWFSIEARTAQHFMPSYSYAQQPISDLGVTTPFVRHGVPVYSSQSPMMNVNFIVTGILIASGMISLLASAVRQRGAERTLASDVGQLCRLLFAVGIAIGLYLVGAYPGHPAASKLDDRLHFVGACMAIFGGNLHSIAFAIFPDSSKDRRPGSLRTLSLFVGLFGITSIFVALYKGGKVDFGTWQRGSVYSIFAWNTLTACYLFANIW